MSSDPVSGSSRQYSRPISQRAVHIRYTDKKTNLGTFADDTTILATGEESAVSNLEKYMNQITINLTQVDITQKEVIK